MTNVFANTREVSGKATPSKTIAAFPDVCLSPPSPPAGPIPIPYPLTGTASDTTEGCSSVYVKGKEAGKKNGTKYSKTTGNEPATNSFGANVITHRLTGPLKFAAYSFDVIFEGGGAERFMDLTTQNHVNADGGSAGFDVAGLDAISQTEGNPCAALKLANQDTFKAIEKKSNAKSTDPEDAEKLKRFKKSGTISHSVLDNCGSRTAQRGTSSGLVRRFDSSFSTPADSTDDVLIDHPEGEKNKSGKVKKRIPSKICGSEFTHPRGGMHAHSEPGILENIDYDNLCPGAKLTMNIEWHQAGNNTPRNDACGNCKKVLKAACQCMAIELCNDDGTTRDACEEDEEMPDA
ncbi:hypothetical protein Rumeso_00989 [Rubellimicrobium mesophilum DSM 19309]|uniref:Uncharacterized protein n=1 Tax=Rubellimicrobium mesophilum DSM 19309 TaxID=442562 RepID=A0A017HSY4_9RHOB|nr:PAAR-like domain-containing protein [Rubellimicrobium mesophilum]EYD77440.1 hypothetical protein Rumeso_00989 [Rubellimicrobium mesophilum DSM 19309]